MTSPTSKREFIPFNNLRVFNNIIREELEEACKQVLNSGKYILGQEVETFEHHFAQFMGFNHCIGVASGTDAITLSLMAIGCGPGETVFTVANSAPATVLAAKRTGAKVRFIDVGENGLMKKAPHLDPHSYFVPVHLYGQTLDLRSLGVAGTRTVEDAAQAAREPTPAEPYKLGSGTAATAISFYPTKNLGAYGDGGAILTNSMEIDRECRRLRHYGLEGPALRSYGLNSRLDELQAAFLDVKIRHLKWINLEKRRLSTLYREQLPHHIRVLEYTEWTNDHLFPIFIEDRHRLKDHLERDGIQTAIHYQIPAHLQEGEKWIPSEPLPMTENLCNQELSLPNWFGMTRGMVKRVCDSIRRFYG